MVDFVAGFMGLDPAGDDGRKYGLWPWQVPGASEPVAPREQPAEPRPPREVPKEAPREERPKERPAEPPPRPAPKPPKWRLEELVP